MGTDPNPDTTIDIRSCRPPDCQVHPSSASGPDDQERSFEKGLTGIYSGKGARFSHLFILDRPARRMCKCINLARFKNQPDHAVLRIVREVRDSDW